MAATARRVRETLPLFDPLAGADQLQRALQQFASSRADGRPRSVSEMQALQELERGRRKLSIDMWEGFAAEAHKKYREERHAPYRDVVPEVLALACDVRIAYVHGLWRSTYDPATRVAQIPPRADQQAQAFDLVHEVAESLCEGWGGTHADTQWVAVALMVERDVASAALNSHGLRGGVVALSRTHRRIRRCFLWVRLAMIAAGGGD
jgi:hypothetical protein